MSVFTPVEVLMANLQRNETAGAVRLNSPRWVKLQKLCERGGIGEHAVTIAPWIDIDNNTQQLVFPPLTDFGFRTFLSGLTEGRLYALFGLGDSETHAARGTIYLNAPYALRVEEGLPPSASFESDLWVGSTLVCEKKPANLTRCALSGTYTSSPKFVVTALVDSTHETRIAVARSTLRSSAFRHKVTQCTYSNKLFLSQNFSFSRVRFRDGSESPNACLELLAAEGVTYLRIAPAVPFVLPSYHGPVRVWNTSAHEATRTAHHYGVELELGFASCEARDALFRQLFGASGVSMDGVALVERDGSLHGVPNGCEIVAAPLPLSDYQDPNGWWQRHLAMLRAATGKGWMYRESAGIHVNMNAAKIPRATLNKIALFITVAFPLSVRIAGRKSIYNSSTTIDPETIERYARARHRLHGTGYWGINTTEYADAFLRRCGESKYSVVSLRNSSRAEVRIFGSNIDTIGFVSCVEYCDAVMAFAELWTSEGIVHRGVRIALDFRKFVFDREPKWPYLCKRMRASAFAKECQ